MSELAQTLPNFLLHSLSTLLDQSRPGVTPESVPEGNVGVALLSRYGRARGEQLFLLVAWFVRCVRRGAYKLHT